MLARSKTALEACFRAVFRKCIARERNVFEVGSIGFTFMFVASGLSLLAVGYDANDPVFQRICCASALAGFMAFMIVHEDD